MHVLIPLCGQGVRFEGAPKPFVQVGPKALLRYAVDTLHLDDHDTVWIFGRPSMRVLFGQTGPWPPHVTWVDVAERTRGAADTVSLGLAKIQLTDNEACVVMDGDAFYKQDVLTPVRHCTAPTLVVMPVSGDEPPVYSYTSLADDMVITDVVEKQPISTWANTGVYAFPSLSMCAAACAHVVASGAQGMQRGEFYMSSVFRHFLQTGIECRAVQVSRDAYVNLGTPVAVREFLQAPQRCAYLFDLDGTLVRTDGMYYKVWEALLQDAGITLTPDLYNTYVRGHADAHVVRLLFSALDDQGAEQLCTKWAQRKHELVAHFLSHATPVLNAVNFCALKQQRGDAVIIVTNSNRACAELLLRHACIPYDTLIIGGECARPKPYSDPYEIAMTAAHVSAHNCIVFEDSPVGILSAQTAGVENVIGIEGTLSQTELFGLGCVDAWRDFRNVASHNANARDLHLQACVAASVRVLPSIVTIDALRLKGGYIADVCGVTVGNTRYVLKMKTPRPVTMLHRMANTLQLHEREFHFYEHVSRYVPVQTPAFTTIVRDVKTHEAVGVLMQRLETDAFLFNVDVNKQPLDVSLAVVRSIAKLHAWSWGKRADVHFKLLRHNDAVFHPSWSQFVSERWPLFEQRWSMTLTGAQLELLRKIASTFDRVQHELSTEPLCICHGDVKAPNLAFARDTMEPVFMDWQYVTYGKGVADVLFYCIESLDPAQYKRWNRVLLEYYKVQLGDVQYTRAQFEHDILAALCHFPFFVAIWFGTTPSSDLIDVNFPFFFIQRYVSVLDEWTLSLHPFLDWLAK